MELFLRKLIFQIWAPSAQTIILLKILPVHFYLWWYGDSLNLTRIVLAVSEKVAILR
jgi:hypothetical protein